jgi:hypothetical protein
MYTMRLNKVVFGMVFITMSVGAFAQEVKPLMEAAKAIATFADESLVPVVVREKHKKEYPKSTLAKWHGYPEALDESEWYGCNPNLYNCVNPKYYVVNFTNDKRQYKVVYTLAGDIVATHISMSTKTIKAVANAIVSSKYADWKIAKAREEIFKGDGSDKLVVYKVEVTKGTQVHYLYFKADGTLIKDKEIK